MLPRRLAAIASVLFPLAACSGGGGGGDGDGALGLKVAAAELGAGAGAAALQTAEGLASARPDDPKRLVLLGQADTATGRLPAAETAFRRALALDPDSFEAGFGLARLHTITDPPAALAELQRLAARHAGDPAVLTDLGVALDLQGRAAEAQSSYRRALALNPTLVSAQVDLGLSLAISGHPREGAEILAPIATGPDGTTRIRANYAVAASLGGDARGAAGMLGRDMPADQARSALLAYQAFDHAAP